MERRTFMSGSALSPIASGANLIYVDPVNDLVVVLRWIEDSKIDEFLKLLVAANR